jgi:pimeloyl-ACP methyl ester carboxylesterase
VTAKRRSTKSRGPKVKTGYVSVNGLRMYYESYGTGAPLVLLHGGIGGTETFARLIPKLARGRRVVAVDLQGHGRTADINRSIRFERMAEDVAGVIQRLRLRKVDLLGYSLGGGVALRTVVQHPELVRKLVLISTAFRRGGWYPEILVGMQSVPENAEAMKQTAMYKEYVRVAPRPEDWPVLLTKLADALRQEYDWSDDIEKIRTPSLVVAGDADSIRPSHLAQFFEHLGGGRSDGGWDGAGISRARLAILPGVTHYNILSSPLLIPIVLEFLGAPAPSSRSPAR